MVRALIGGRRIQGALSLHGTPLLEAPLHRQLLGDRMRARHSWLLLLLLLLLLLHEQRVKSSTLHGWMKARHMRFGKPLGHVRSRQGGCRHTHECVRQLLLLLLLPVVAAKVGHICHVVVAATSPWPAWWHHAWGEP